MNILDTVSTGAQAVPRAALECLVEPFIEAIKLTFTEMAGTDVVVLGSYRTPRVMTLGDISALIRYSGGGGAFILGFPGPVALAVSKRILTSVLPADGEIDDALMCDCLGEIANVVAGQAKALLAQTPHHFAFSTPEVVHGPLPADLANHAPDCLAVVFRSGLGEFVLQISQAQV